MESQMAKSNRGWEVVTDWVQHGGDRLEYRLRRERLSSEGCGVGTVLCKTLPSAVL